MEDSRLNNYMEPGIRPSKPRKIRYSYHSNSKPAQSNPYDRYAPQWYTPQNNYEQPSPNYKPPQPEHQELVYSTTADPSHYSSTSSPPDPKEISQPIKAQTPEPTANVMEFLGFYSNVPTLNALKFCSIIILTIIVELNLIFNIPTSKVLADFLFYKPTVLIGIGLIGVFIGILFRYAEFESEQLKVTPKNPETSKFKTYLKLFFIILIMIFILIEVFVELINARGILFLIDITSISIMIIGTYAVLSGRKYLIHLAIIFIFIIMLFGIDKGPDILMLVLLGGLTVIYIEVTDGACRLQEYIQKFRKMLNDQDSSTLLKLDTHMDELSVQFAKNLGLFMSLTLVISGFLLALYIGYPYITPAFMHENLELQTVYAMLPIILLLFLIFIIVYIFTRRSKLPKEKSDTG